MKCEKCDREFSEEKNQNYPGKIYVHKGKMVCETCLVDMGVSLDEAHPYQTYIDIRLDLERDVQLLV